MFKGRIAFKLTAGFVVIVLVSMMTIGILFIQMFQQYTFDSREQTMLSRARSIAEVMAENSQSTVQFRGFAGSMRFLDTLYSSESNEPHGPYTINQLFLEKGKLKV